MRIDCNVVRIRFEGSSEYELQGRANPFAKGRANPFAMVVRTRLQGSCESVCKGHVNPFVRSCKYEQMVLPAEREIIIWMKFVGLSAKLRVVLS